MFYQDFRFFFILKVSYLFDKNIGLLNFNKTYLPMLINFINKQTKLCLFLFILKLYCGVDDGCNYTLVQRIEYKYLNKEIHKITNDVLINTLVRQKIAAKMKLCKKMIDLVCDNFSDSKLDPFKLFLIKYNKVLYNIASCTKNIFLMDIAYNDKSNVNYFNLYQMIFFYMFCKEIVWHNTIKRSVNEDYLRCYYRNTSIKERFERLFKDEYLFITVKFEILIDFNSRLNEEFSKKMKKILDGISNCCDPCTDLSWQHESHIYKNLKKLYHDSSIENSIIYIDQVSIFEYVYDLLYDNSTDKFDCLNILEIAKQVSVTIVSNDITKYLNSVGSSRRIPFPTFIMFSLGECMKLLRETIFWSHLTERELPCFYIKKNINKKKDAENTDFAFFKDYDPTYDLYTYKCLIEMCDDFIQFWRFITESANTIQELKDEILGYTFM